MRRFDMGHRPAAIVCLATMLALGAGSTSARAADDAWSKDAGWVSARFGYAKSAAEFAPDGSVGYGFGFTRFLQNSVSWSATVEHNLLGQYGSASEIEVPFTVDFAKHMRWSGSTRPYLGMGWGAVFHKTYRTGADESDFRQAIFFATGANGALGSGNLLGLDVRLFIEQDTRSINPTFPNAKPSGSVWSAKLTYSRQL